jgi:acyl carrier protein
MNPEEIRRTALSVLTEVAPDIDVSDIDPALNLQEQFDLDSLDFYSFVVALHEQLGVDVPERDYPKLATLDGCVSYLSSATAAAASPL